MKHVTIISALWLWGIILLVLYGACYWRNCLKLQTVSYAVCISLHSPRHTDL